MSRVTPIKEADSAVWSLQSVRNAVLAWVGQSCPYLLPPTSPNINHRPPHPPTPEVEPSPRNLRRVKYRRIFAHEPTDFQNTKMNLRAKGFVKAKDEVLGGGFGHGEGEEDGHGGLREVRGGCEEGRRRGVGGCGGSGGGDVFEEVWDAPLSDEIEGESVDLCGLVVTLCGVRAG